MLRTLTRRLSGAKKLKISRNLWLLHRVTRQRMRRNDAPWRKYHCRSLRGRLKVEEEARICMRGRRRSPAKRWVHVMWLGEEGWAPGNTSGMNSTPAMAPLSPGLSSSPPLVQKNTNFQSLGSLSVGMVSPSLAKGACPQVRQGSSPLNSPSPSIMSSPKLWHKASVSRLAEEFFWIGGSVVAQPKWRLGQMGKIHSWLKSETPQTRHPHFFFKALKMLRCHQVTCQNVIYLQTR